MTRYSSEITSGSLMLPASRRIAALMLTHPTPAQWTEAVTVSNILQARSPASAVTHAKVIRRRLAVLDEEGWALVANAEQEVAIQILLASAIKHSRLLRDYMREVYRDKVRRFETRLTRKDWEIFFAHCIQRDPAVADWSPSTQGKAREIIHRILAEAGYLDSTRKLGLTPPMLHPTTVKYLKAHAEKGVLACMAVNS